MTFITPQPYISYKHIEAKTPSELEILMLSISVKASSPVNFTPPEFTGGKWHSWFLYDWSLDIRPKDKFEMESSNDSI